MDIPLLVAGGVAAVYGNPIVQGIVANRGARGIDAIVSRLAERSPGDVTWDVDLAYATWWACLQTGAFACSQASEEAGADRRPIKRLRKRLLSEARALKRNRQRYFRRHAATESTVARTDPEQVRRYLAEGDLLRRYLCDWIQFLAGRGKPAPMPVMLKPFLAETTFGPTFKGYLGEALKRDERARTAYDVVVLQTINDVVHDLADRGPTPDLEQVIGRLTAEGREARDLLAELTEQERRRQAANELANAAAGRNARLLVEQRVEDLAAKPLVGRDETLEELRRILSERQSASILVVAPPGYGKSSFLAHWLRREGHLWGHVAYHFVDIDRGPQASTRARAFGNVLDQMLAHFDMQLDLTKDPESQVGALLEREKELDARPLIVLIDGLDEITDWDSAGPTLLLQGSLPPNVFVIASVRSNEEQGSDPARHWTRDEEIWLGPLPTEAIPEALAAYGDGELLEEAGNADLCRRLEGATSGIPLYLDFALQVAADEVREGRSPLAALGEAATKTERRPPSAEDRFADFLRNHLKHLHAVIPDLSRRPEYRLLRLLVAAGVPLYEEDLLGLGIDPLSLVDLRVMRWIATPEAGVYSLPHRFLGRSLALAFGSGALARDRADLQQLADSWRARPSQYAARHLPKILEEKLDARDEDRAEKRQALLALAADRRFLEMQMDLAANDPLLPSRTLVRAAQIAAEAGDTIAAIDLAMLAVEIGDKLESPVQALRQEAPLSRLMGLVQALEGNCQASWCALVDLALGLERPDEQKAFRVWHVKMLDAQAEPALEMAASSKIDRALIALAARRGDFHLAEQLASRIYDQRERSMRLADIAAFLREADENGRAVAVAAQARETAALLDLDERRAGLITVAERLAEGGLEAEARKSVVEACEPASDDPERLTRGLARAAQKAAELGESEIALKAARRAAELADSAFSIAYAALTLARLGDMATASKKVARAMAEASPTDWETRRFAAETLAAMGDDGGARALAGEALAVANSIEEPNWRERSLRAVAKTLANLGDAERHLEAQNAIDSIDKEDTGFNFIDHEAAEQGWLEEGTSFLYDDEIELPGEQDSDRQAIETLAKALDSRVRYTRTRHANHTLAAIAKALAMGCYHEEALGVAAGISDEPIRAQALATTALSLAEAGERRRAIELAKDALALEEDEAQVVFGSTSTIARTLTVAGRKGEALELARALQPGPDCHALSMIATTLSDRGDDDAALSVAREASDAAWNVIRKREELRASGLDPRTTEALARIAPLLATLDDKEDALKAAAMAWEGEVQVPFPYVDFSPEMTANALATLVIGENTQDVRQRFDDLGPSRITAGLLAQGAEALVGMGRGDLAASMLSFIATWEFDDSADHAAALAATASPLAAIGDREGARHAVEEAISVMSSLPVSGRRWARMDVAKGLLAIGEVEAAAILAQEQLEEAVSKEYQGKETLEAIRLLAVHGYEEVAIQYAQGQCETLAEIAKALASAKQRPQCFRVAHEALLALAEPPEI